MVLIWKINLNDFSRINDQSNPRAPQAQYQCCLMYEISISLFMKYQTCITCNTSMPLASIRSQWEFDYCTYLSILAFCCSRERATKTMPCFFLSKTYSWMHLFHISIFRPSLSGHYKPTLLSLMLTILKQQYIVFTLYARSFLLFLKLACPNFLTISLQKLIHSLINLFDFPFDSLSIVTLVQLVFGELFSLCCRWVTLLFFNTGHTIINRCLYTIQPFSRSTLRKYPSVKNLLISLILLLQKVIPWMFIQTL